MSANKKGQRKSSTSKPKDNGSVFESYGGLNWNQIRYSSLYQHNSTQGPIGYNEVTYNVSREKEYIYQPQIIFENLLINRLRKNVVKTLKKAWSGGR